MRRCLLVPLLLLAPAACAAPTTLESANLRRTVTVQVVRKTKDAVVNISATRIVARRMAGPFWFDMGDVVRVPANSLGSGFVIHRDGYVVTNHHVVDRARQINVELGDGRKLSAQLISSDPEADLAILKIADAKPLPTVELGDSSDLMIGEPVVAVGNPMGYSHSVSTGIVSAIHRDLKDERERVPLSDLVQTDAAINPGNSGGPLLNAYGQVIGINTAIRGDAQNIGFAIQVNKLRGLIPELMSPSHVSKLEIPLKLSESRKVEEPATVSATCVLEGVRGGTVESIDGQKPANIVDAYAILLRAQPAQKQVTVKLADGSQRTFDIRAAAVPGAVSQARAKLGITIEQLTPMLAEKHRLGVEDGLLITEVARGSIAAKAGLEPGDIIVQLGRYRVSTLEDLGRLLPLLPANGRVRVGIIRGDQMAFGMIEMK